MKRGDAYELTIGSSVIRAVIVTADRYNPNHVQAVPVRPRAAAPGVPGLLIPTGDDDPKDVRGGTIDVKRLRHIDVSAVRARLGAMSRTTMITVDDRLRAYLSL